MSANIVAAPAAPLSPAQGGLRAHLGTTPGRLQLALLLLTLAPLLVWMAAARSVAQTQRAIQTIQNDAAPSIIAADAAHADLADMDANAANGFLGSGAEKHELKAYELKRLDADDQLLAAAQNITYPGERTAIQTMNTQLQVYTGLVESARAFKSDSEPARGLPLLLQASDLMHTQILPAADTLGKINDDQLEAGYKQIQADNAGALAGLLGAGGVALAVLLGTQLYLSRRTRRTLNGPLALATLLLLLFVGRLAAVLVAERADLKLAKVDSFDSVNALWGATATAYAANGYESLYLLAQAPAQKAQYETAFRTQAALLADAPITQQIVDGAEQNIPKMQSGQQIADANPNAVTFHGDIATELNNVTFPGERDVALTMLEDYKSYMDIDGQIRALERAGRHQDAVSLCIGYRKGQSDYAFNQFDEALTQTRKINVQHFNDASAQARGRLGTFPLFDPLAAALLVALAWFGLLPRLQEYRP